MGIYTERALADVMTGTTAVQYREENLFMTVIVHGKDARDLRGKAFITLDRITVFIDDDRWTDIIGHRVCLEGGTELDIDNNRLDEMLEGYDYKTDGVLGEDVLVPVIIRDIYMPKAKALVQWGDLANRVNVIQPGDGVRATGECVPCPTSCGKCISCYHTWWVNKTFDKIDR